MDSVLVMHLMKNPDIIGGHPLANCLANGSYNLDIGICWFDSMPLWAGEALVDDLIGVSRPRLVRVM
ncbi:hypothetical protein L3X38_022401 [Prunus dulcis]|uniref:Uncharacterized protein n=1 Tax=Prunus dulcis TaxID=3755 RepID=A0AAD4Z3I0_PRUDU|nr:hypothetical protein L3X38_022401 [Prunus dulcis]